MDASASRLPAFLLCVSAVAASAPDFCTQHKCLAHYPLSTDAKDVSNNGMDGVNNEVAFATGEGPGGASCARFDTRKDGTYIAIPDAAALKDLKEWTFSTWFRCIQKPCSMIYHESYYSKSPLESHHKNTLLLGRGGFFDNWPPVGAPQSELEGDLDVDVTDGKWHHAAYVKETSNGVTVMFYLDGKLAATKDWERYTGKATTQNLIGGHRPKYRDGEADAFDGFMWDLYLFNESLSADSIKEIAERTRLPTQCKTRTPAYLGTWYSAEQLAEWGGPLYDCEGVRDDGKGLTSIPTEFPSATALVNLQYNMITSVPAGIFDSTTNLRVLYLAYNQITSIAARVFTKLAKLVELQVYENKIEYLPDNIFPSPLEKLYYNKPKHAVKGSGGNPCKCTDAWGYKRGLAAEWRFHDWGADGRRPKSETLGPDMVYSGSGFGATESTVTIVPGEGLDLTPSTHAYTELADFGLGEARTITSVLRMKSDQGAGGSVLTLNRPNTDYFDAIVWAERQTRKWMAGSSGFSRTEDISGGDLEETQFEGQEQIMMTIVYSQDGTIQLYRNGLAYGGAYKTGQSDYPKGKLFFAFGSRFPSLDCKVGCMDATIAAAFVHDRALTANEVQGIDLALLQYILYFCN
eukprot:gene10351-28178_t